VCAFSKAFGFFAKLSCLSNWRLSLSIQGSGFSKVSGLPKSGLLAMVIFQIWRSQKISVCLFLA
jgi:hypothetical protein